MSAPNKLNQQFNINDIDTTMLTKALSEHQNTVVKLVLIVGALVWIILMFSDTHHKQWELRFKISQAQQKIQTMKQRDDSVTALQKYKSTLPKSLNEFEFITLISNYTKLQNINMTSFSPAESKDMGIYDTITISFNAIADNFKDMMFFIRKIERSSFPIKINSWSGHEEENGKIDFTISISAVVIKE